jgi:hypothetical protein
MSVKRAAKILENLSRAIALSWTLTAAVAFGIVLNGSASALSGWVLLGIVVATIGYVWWLGMPRDSDGGDDA